MTPVALKYSLALLRTSKELMDYLKYVDVQTIYTFYILYNVYFIISAYAWSLSIPWAMHGPCSI